VREPALSLATPPIPPPSSPMSAPVRTSPSSLSSSLRTLLAPLASLKLTVALLLLAMLLIFAGTWAQIDAGIWDVQAKYFHSFITRIDFQLFMKRPPPGEAPFALNLFGRAIPG